MTSDPSNSLSEPNDPTLPKHCITLSGGVLLMEDQRSTQGQGPQAFKGSQASHLNLLYIVMIGAKVYSDMVDQGY